MVVQITRIRNANLTETLLRHSDNTTLPYSGANVTAILSGVTDPVFVLKRFEPNGIAHAFTLQCRDQNEFTTANFENVWNLLIAAPSQRFGTFWPGG
jgi:hypothetical protein